MERAHTRLDAVRERMDARIKALPDEETKREAYVHLYGVGLMASLLAIRRGHSRQTAELAEIAGMLHDLFTFIDPGADRRDHALPCARYARDHILAGLEGFSAEETEMICQGIAHHSDKETESSWFDEIIKDADALQHALRNPAEEYFYGHPRVQRVLRELL